MLLEHVPRLFIYVKLVMLISKRQKVNESNVYTGELVTIAVGYIHVCV